MPTTVKTCRVCGKSYEACHTMSKAAGVFRWQEVACSPECGAEYLRRVTEARNPVPHNPKPRKEKRETDPIAETACRGKGPTADPEFQIIARTPAEEL